MEEKSENSNRRTNKPLMEKRRRARINTCLGELKTLVLMALNKDNSQFSKLEKADILEMAVKYLRHVQNASIATHAMDSVAVTKYRLGYGECAQEVLNCLGPETVAEDLRQRVSDHLSKCLYGVHSVGRSSIGSHIIQNYRGETSYFESPDIGTSKLSRQYYKPNLHRPVVDTTTRYVPRQFQSIRSNYSSNRSIQTADSTNGHRRTIKIESERNQQFEIDQGLSHRRQQTPKCKPSSTVSSPDSTAVTEEPRTHNPNIIDKSSVRNLHLQRKQFTNKRKASDSDMMNENDTETNSGQSSSKQLRPAEDLEASGDKSDDESVWRPW